MTQSASESDVLRQQSQMACTDDAQRAGTQVAIELSMNKATLRRLGVVSLVPARPVTARPTSDKLAVIRKESK